MAAPEQQPTPAPSRDASRHATSPAWVRVIAPWVIASLVAAGLVGVALRSAQDANPSLLDRLAPDGPGTTWVYREVTNGTPTGTATLRVASTARPVLTEGPRIEVHVDNYLGRGLPHDEVRYQAKQGNRLVLVGYRQSGAFSQLTPAQTLLELPVRTGRTFTWRGKRDIPAADLSVTTRVVGVGTLSVGGQRRNGCPHLSDETVESSAGKPDFRTSADRWLCPGLGEVRIRTDAPSLGVRLDEELQSAHGPGVDFGPPTPLRPAAAAGGASGASLAPGQGPAIDTSRLAWSDTRLNTVQFPPVGHQGLVVVEEEGGRVTAFDPRGGKFQWDVEIAVPAAAGPAVADDAVLVPDAAKHLLALDPATGATRWAATFVDIVSAQPLVVGDRAIVATEDGALHAVALADGRSLWSSSLSAPPSGMATAGGDIFVASFDGSVTARSAATGAIRWSSHLQGRTTAGPVAASGIVVAADDQNQLSAFDAATGRIRWTDYLRVGVNLPLAVAGSTLLLADGRRVGAYDLGSGRHRWTADAGATVASPAAVGDEVIVATRDKLVRLSLADGTRRAVVSLPRPGPGLRPRAALTPTMIAGQLLVTLIVDPGVAWPHTTILAFPDRREPGPDGVRFTGAYRQVPAPPARTPLLRGNDLVIVTRAGTVFDVPAAGSPRTVLTVKATGSFLVSAGNLLLTRDGNSLVAAGPSGRVWAYPLGAPSLADVPSVSPASVLVPVAGKGLAALSPSSGGLQWFYPSTGQGQTTPLVLPGGDAVYAVGGLARLDGATGTVRWRIPGFDAFGPPTENAGSIFATGFLDGDQVLLAVDEATGVIRWRLPVPVKLLSGPAAAGSAVAVVGGDNSVRVVDAGSGQLRWTLPLATSMSGSPVIANGRLVVAEEGRIEDVAQLDHRVTVYDLGTGRFLGAFEPGGSSFGIDSFGARAGRLLFPTLAGGSVGVYLLGLATP